jgi:hypothetical protein
MIVISFADTVACKDPLLASRTGIWMVRIFPDVVVMPVVHLEVTTTYHSH